MPEKKAPTGSHIVPLIEESLGKLKAWAEA